MRGKFIVLEGGEGCGKSTQQKLLQEYLINKGFELFITREPGGAKISEQIREILLSLNNKEMFSRTELFLYEAARAQFIHEILKPKLNKGKFVLTDRYYYSTIAYQGYARGLDIDKIKVMNSYATEEIIPDLVLIFDVPVETGLERAKKVTGGKGDRLEQENVDFHNKVREGYLALPELLPEENIVIIDATGSIEEIFEKVKQEVEKII